LVVGVWVGGAVAMPLCVAGKRRAEPRVGVAGGDEKYLCRRGERRRRREREVG
jgi:hypothetical protein